MRETTTIMVACDASHAAELELTLRDLAHVFGGFCRYGGTVRGFEVFRAQVHADDAQQLAKDARYRVSVTYSATLRRGLLSEEVSA